MYTRDTEIACKAGKKKIENGKKKKIENNKKQIQICREEKGNPEELRVSTM